MRNFRILSYPLFILILQLRKRSIFHLCWLNRRETLFSHLAADFVSSGHWHMWGLTVFSGSQWPRARLCCRKISDSKPRPHYFTPRWPAGAMPRPKKVQKKYTKRKDRNRQETKTLLPYFPLFTWWMDEPTLRPKTQRGAQKHQTVKSVLSVRRHHSKRGRFTENLSIYLSTPAPNSLLQNLSNFGATASHWLLYFLLFFFFLIFNRMDAWSLMRGDAFIHFVSGSRRVNIRLGVLLLIPKSPHI